MGWIGVDLDGTLAQYKTGQGAAIGKPIAPMAKRVKAWCKDKKEVRIFTARAETLKGKREVERWLKDNGLPALAVTNIKDSKMAELWDDKAIRVTKNAGHPCKGCENSSAFHQHDNPPDYFTNC
ncbi:hypothetical protein PCO82_04955 [Pectobacteriaceae bacterium CE90]|nr:hypothetical protein [Prodigiosinella sp. LS101]WJV52935.1 hypothetical protein PCO85_17285 [Prodigiosinella sp. LS101]WJV57290.1 hypothetical protein PCO84_17265 [Pectobacteriaceae bacterium C111]WJY14497.1 hypothetical protein PCO82_18720 [Pectobacteriaceae bacterium CE90]WJY16034.1 hypothetical protein PCO82_04955 [Pectobacteriaceae bacterium CE90]